MASRNLLYVDDNNDLVEMSSAEMLELQKRMIYAYSVAPTAVLTQVSGSGANIDAMSDTRKQAGATSQSSTAFVAEGSTAEPGTVTVSYDKVNLAYTTSGVVKLLILEHLFLYIMTVMEVFSVALLLI